MGGEAKVFCRLYARGAQLNWHIHQLVHKKKKRGGNLVLNIYVLQ